MRITVMVVWGFDGQKLGILEGRRSKNNDHEQTFWNETEEIFFPNTWLFSWFEIDADADSLGGRASARTSSFSKKRFLLDDPWE